MTKCVVCKERPSAMTFHGLCHVCLRTLRNDDDVRDFYDAIRWAASRGRQYEHKRQKAGKP